MYVHKLMCTLVNLQCINVGHTNVKCKLKKDLFIDACAVTSSRCTFIGMSRVGNGELISSFIHAHVSQMPCKMDT